MIHYITYIKDVIGNNYLGIKVDDQVVKPFLEKMKTDLGDKFDEFTSNQQKRDRGSYHMTVINVMDFNKLAKSIGHDKFLKQVSQLFTQQIDDIKMMGLGKASRNENTAYFVVCNSKKLDEIRKMYGLKEHDFHITLGFRHKDVFGVRKNQVFEPNKEFIDRIKSKFLEKENFNFVRNIGNFDENPELEIIPISISDDYLKVKVGDNILNIGLIDTKDGEKLWILNRYIDDKDEKRVPMTTIIEFLKEK